MVAFCSGAAVMIFELTASRAIAPYLGSSLITWTSLIGVVLVSLSLGNWVGGLLADRSRRRAVLPGLFLAGALLLLATNLGKSFLLDPLSTWQADLRLRTVLAAVVLLSPVSVLLGMVGPLVTKQLLNRVEEGGRTFGSISALGNLGSIVGTFLTGFLLLPYLGTTTVLTVLAGVLGLLALLSFPGRPTLASFLIIPVTAVGIPISRGTVYANAQVGFIDADTEYSRVWIKSQPFAGETLQLFQIDRQYSSARYVGSDELVFSYNRAFQVADLYRTPEQALLIGGAGYTFPRAFLQRHQKARMDVVEVDPGVTALARKHFGLEDHPRLTIVHADGRAYLNTTDAVYDTIVIDAFSNLLSIPFQLATVEAVELLRAHLTPDGVVTANIISAVSGKQAAVLESIGASFQHAFPYVRIIPLEPLDESVVQNIVLFASNRPLDAPRPARNPEEQVFLTNLREVPVGKPALTDDLAPVDLYTSYFGY